MIQESHTNIPAAIKAIAEHIEDYGNSGIYGHALIHGLRWVVKPKYKNYRSGILYYSRGHGWRVRKNPHWRTVFDKRFSEWFDSAGFKVEMR